MLGIGGAGGDANNNTGNVGAGYGAGGSMAVLFNQPNGTSGTGGGYLEKTIVSPSASYTYSVGGAGNQGSAGTGGFHGGAGTGGIIIIEEYYI
jgi:hypothetical protein